MHAPHRIAWAQVANRLILLYMAQVAKRLILLYIFERPGGPAHDTPSCLQSFAVSGLPLPLGCGLRKQALCAPTPRCTDIARTCRGVCMRVFARWLHALGPAAIPIHTAAVSALAGCTAACMQGG